MSRSEIPLVRIALPLILGIISGKHLSPDFIRVGWGIVVVLLTWLSVSATIPKLRLKLLTANGLVIHLIFLVLGMNLYWSATLGDAYPLSPKKRTYLARLIDQPKKGKYDLKMVFELQSCREDTQWKPCRGKVLVEVKDSLNINSTAIDDLWLIRTSFHPPEQPSNPGGFDYSAYLSSQGIHHIGNVKAGHLHWLSHGSDGLLSWARRVRTVGKARMSSFGLAEQPLAIASALIFGDKLGLEQEVKTHFAGAGAMHVLAVSGLHVGIIYLMMNAFLSVLGKRRSSRLIRCLLLLIVLWSYVLISGGSPSVIRAASMFSFLALGELMSRSTQSLNLLAASAIVLLIIDPTMIDEVGFQLSYLAVTGILLIHPPLYDLWQPSHFVMDKIWSLTVLSVAAQLATFPLALYYFNQFPNYFLLTNLIVVPAVGVILYMGLAALALSWITGLARLLFQCFSWGLDFLLWITQMIFQLPYSISEHLYPDIVEVILMYVIIAGLITFLWRRTGAWLFRLVLLITVFIGYVRWKDMGQQDRKGIVIYSHYNDVVFGLIDGNVQYLVGEVSDEKCKKIAGGGMQAFDLEQTLYYDLNDSLARHPNFGKSGRYLSFTGLNFLILDQYENRVLSGDPMPLDFIILSGNVEVNIADLEEQYEVGRYILAAHNSPYRIKKWIDDLEKYSRLYYDIRKQGAYVQWQSEDQSILIK